MKEEIIKFKSLRKKWHQAPRHFKTTFFFASSADTNMVPPAICCLPTCSVTTQSDVSYGFTVFIYLHFLKLVSFGTYT